MREIKFRAWDGEKLHTQGFWVTPSGRIELIEYYWEGKLPTLEVMQSTGLKDKTERDIYEGDIVNISRRLLEIDPVTRRTPERDAELISVKWIPAMAAYNIRPDYILNADVYEVLGNIYENPELLKPEV